MSKHTGSIEVRPPICRHGNNWFHCEACDRYWEAQIAELEREESDTDEDQQ